MDNFNNQDPNYGDDYGYNQEYNYQGPSFNNQQETSIEEQIRMQEELEKGSRVKTIIKVVVIVFAVIIVGIISYVIGNSVGTSNTETTYQEQIASMREDYELQILEMEEEVEETIATAGNPIAPETTIRGITIDGETKNAIFLRDGDVILPQSMDFPEESNVTVDLNETDIRIGQSYTIRPLSTWYTVIKGSEIELIHTKLDIWGKIKSYLIDTPVYDMETMQYILTDFLRGVDTREGETYTFEKITLRGRDSGIYATVPVHIHREVGTEGETTQTQQRPMNMVVGFVNNGANMIQFIFLAHDGEIGTEVDTIESLLSTMKLKGESVLLE